MEQGGRSLKAAPAKSDLRAVRSVARWIRRLFWQGSRPPQYGSAGLAAGARAVPAALISESISRHKIDRAAYVGGAKTRSADRCRELAGARACCAGSGGQCGALRCGGRIKALVAPAQAAQARIGLAFAGLEVRLTAPADIHLRTRHHRLDAGFRRRPGGRVFGLGLPELDAVGAGGCRSRCGGSWGLGSLCGHGAGVSLSC